MDAEMETAAVRTPATTALQPCGSPFCEERFEPRRDKAFCSDRCRVRAWHSKREAPTLYAEMARMQTTVRDLQQRLEALEARDGRAVMHQQLMRR
jgi:hypothetical protein